MSHNMPPFDAIKPWAPFKINTLSIFALLGAANLRKTIGRLVYSPYSEYFPLLSAHIFADNAIAEIVTGFALCNVTDGISVWVYILKAYRLDLDQHLEEAGEGIKADEIKLSITLPTGQVMTAFTTRRIIMGCLLTEAKPTNHDLHLFVRAIGWLAFSLHAVTLGMASLSVQFLLITTILLFAILAVQRIGCDESRIGGRLQIQQNLGSGRESKAKTFVKMCLNDKEEQNMTDWFIFPRLSSTVWWIHTGSSEPMQRGAER
ncbi:hypothetical protein K469DRAFT_697868 [Zopfia rhizophila CBS 207.26]|uniref:Uncharacterized protein n=1 Tax=Zopfia rhizophila CBS 207.26 TaxID=1314779 RepID=A0A6A6EH64_9PEZI|nr:hypothetical protein K469DRAFT_697868 [Zopfia rhizophila CBS 207.26]